MAKKKAATLKQDKNNLREHSEENKRLIQKSFDELGAGRSGLADATGEMIAGNASLEAAQKSGKKIKIIESDGETYFVIKRTDLKPNDKKRKELAIADNVTTDTSNFIEEKFNEEHFKEILFEEWGLKKKENIQAQEDDFEIVIPKKAITKKGDLYELISEEKGLVHRVHCGDSTNIDDVKKLMNDHKADMVFTDPPYNVNFKGQELNNTTKNGIVVNEYKSANTKHKKIGNDNLKEKDFLKFMVSVLSNMMKYNKGAWYVSFCDLKLDLLLLPMKTVGLKWKSILIWRKNQSTLSGKDYKSRYEPIVYGSPRGCFKGERFKQEDIWDFQRTLKNDLHPTMKPVPLIINAINNSSETKNIVLDLFLGSGSTLIASEQTKRNCYGMELDEKYCDIILKRSIHFMEKENLKYSIKLNGKPLSKAKLNKFRK